MSRGGVAVCLVALLSLSRCSLAGPLANDPAALAQFRGTAHFNANNVLKVDLDYAVFPPGTYPNDNSSGHDPSGGIEYVYAFQAFNVSATRTLTTIGITLTKCSGTHHLMLDPLHPTQNGSAPSDLLILPDSITIDFLEIQLAPGSHSPVILFTSWNPPSWVLSAAQDGGLADQKLVPSPLPGAGIPSDFDQDCDVDSQDALHFFSCASGPGIPFSGAGCKNADLDLDGDVDQTDFGLFQRCYAGSDQVIDPDCIVP